MTTVQRIIPGSGGQTETIDSSQLTPGEVYYEAGVRKVYAEPVIPSVIPVEQVMKALPAELPAPRTAEELPELLSQPPTPIRVPKPSGVDQTTIMMPGGLPSVRPSVTEARKVVGEAERVVDVKKQISEIESARRELTPIKDVTAEQLRLVRSLPPSTQLEYTVDGVMTVKTAGEVESILAEQQERIGEAEKAYSTEISRLKSEAQFKPVGRKPTFIPTMEISPVKPRGISGTEAARILLRELEKAGLPFDPDAPGAGMIAFYEESLRTGLVTLPEAMAAFGLKPIEQAVEARAKFVPGAQPVVSETELLAPKPSPVTISQIWESPLPTVQAIPSLEVGFKLAAFIETTKDIVKISEAIETALNLRALKEVMPVTKLLKEKEGVYRAISEVDISEAYPLTDPNTYKIIQESRLVAKEVPAELITAFPEGEIAVPVKGVIIKGKPEIGVTALVKESAITGKSTILRQAITEVPEITGAVIKEVRTPTEIRRAVLLQESDELKGILLQSEYLPPIPFKAKAPPVEITFGLESASVSFIRQPDLDIYGLSAAFKKGKVTVTPSKVTGITRPYEAVSSVVEQSTKALQEEVTKAAASIQLTKEVISTVTRPAVATITTKTSVDVATAIKPTIPVTKVEVSEKPKAKIKPVDLFTPSVEVGQITGLKKEVKPIRPVKEIISPVISEEVEIRLKPVPGEIKIIKPSLRETVIPPIVIPPTIFPPSIPIVPIFKPEARPKEKKRKERVFYRKKAKYAYTPSVSAIIAGKRGKKPKKRVFTGFEERPIPIRKSKIKERGSPFKATIKF